MRKSNAKRTMHDGSGGSGPLRIPPPRRVAALHTGSAGVFRFGATSDKRAAHTPRTISKSQASASLAYQPEAPTRNPRPARPPRPCSALPQVTNHWWNVQVWRGVPGVNRRMWPRRFPFVRCFLAPRRFVRLALILRFDFPAPLVSLRW